MTGPVATPSTTTTLSSSSSANSKGRMIEGKYSEQHLYKTAKDIVNEKTAGSKILDIEAEGFVPKFDQKEIILGRVLGRGGFGVVSEIKKIQLRDEPSTSKGNDDDDDDDDDEAGIYNDFVQNRAFMGSHYLRGKKQDSRYALKVMQESCFKDASTFVNAIVDLAMEARFLTVIRHSNIIKMRAMSGGSPYDAKFFVIMDRLYDTLFVRLKKWKKQEPPKGKLASKILDRKGKKKAAFWVERITVAYDLTCALKYLHDNHIMYRDLKPDNIGFDVRGDVKIFDFGLAKEYDPATQRDANGFYKFTGDTGSPRYMDPTVALEQPYDERCDVYSFCILLWEMLELSPPFQGYTISMFQKKVVKEGARPMINSKWPAEIAKLLKEGWGDISDRPSMAEVSEVLRDELNEYSEDGDGFDSNADISRKSDVSARMLRSKSIMSMRALKMK